MTETQQRFLRAIAERVPMGQVVELHLFPPIRQGGVETGVAVVAEDPRRPVAAVADPDLGDPELADTVADAEVADAVLPDADLADPDLTDANLADAPLAADAVEIDDSPYAVSPRDDHGGDDDDFDDDEDGDGDDDDLDDDEDVDDEDDDILTSAEESAARVASRLTIHTARYRLTLKGVDRGKWEVDVVAEADAPLAALDAVVRGVQRRAGEGAEPDRLSADALRDALEAPLASLER